MRSWFTWLLVFGVMAGLWGRVLSLDHQHGKKEVAACCDHDHSHDGSDSQGDAGDHGKDCPPWPHDHHHTCCHQAPLAGAEVPNPGLVPPGASWLGVTWSTALPPDEPVFTLDKPPLI